LVFIGKWVIKANRNAAKLSQNWQISLSLRLNSEFACGRWPALREIKV